VIAGALAAGVLGAVVALAFRD